MRLLRVLVCGTNYGRSYLDAIDARPHAYRLAGIVARGSARSHDVASACGVPLYSRVADAPPDIDLACVAVGSAGSDITFDLLDRRVHVLAEHPCRSEHIATAVALAAERRVGFHMNPHFPYLSAARAFIRQSARLRSCRPVFVQATLTERSLYGALDILRRVLGPFGEIRFSAIGRLDSFAILGGQIAGIPASLHIQASAVTQGSIFPDGSSRYLVDYRLVVGWTHGILTLCSIAGPVVWNANFSAARPDDELWVSIYGRRLSAAEMRIRRFLANLHAMDTLAARLYGQPAPGDQDPEHLLDVSRGWEVLLASL